MSTGARDDANGLTVFHVGRFFQTNPSFRWDVFDGAGDFELGGVYQSGVSCTTMS